MEMGAADERTGCRCGEPDNVSLRFEAVEGPRYGPGKLGFRSRSRAGGDGFGTERIDWMDDGA